MNTFDRDLAEALAGNEIEVFKRRKAEIQHLENEMFRCKNGFRRQCIAQEIERKKAEYNKLDEMVSEDY